MDQHRQQGQDSNDLFHIDHLKSMGAVRANGEKKLKEQFVRGRPLRISDTAILATHLTELAGPVRQQQRWPLVDERGIGRSFRPVISSAAEPAPGKLILAAGVHAERIWRRVLLLSPAPEEFRPAKEAPVNGAAKRPVAEGRVDRQDSGIERGSDVVLAPRD